MILPRTRPLFVALFLTMAVLATRPAPGIAQYRYGISIGGAASLSLIVERRWEHQGLEVQLGTWGFRDLGVTVSGKQYIGSSDVQPFVGVGLWGLVAFAEEGTGFGLIARAPIGLDWNISGDHSAALTVFVNRALALKRPDPADDRPPRAALIPLPEFSYRWLNR